MSKEAWKDTGNCNECRRAKYCNKQCKASKMRMQKIIEISARAAIGRMIIQNGDRYAEEARKKLETLLRANNKDDNDDAVDAAFERCKDIAAHSTRTVAQIVYEVAYQIEENGESFDNALQKAEAQYKVFAQKGY